MTLLAGAAALAMLTSCTLTWVVREVARRHGWMSRPDTARHIHKYPIPRLGGVAVYFAVAATLLGISAVGRFSSTGSVSKLLIPVAFLLLIGVADDLAGLTAKRKLLAQIVAATFLFVSGLQLPMPGFIGNSGLLSTGISLVVTVFWSTAVMNAINLIDGLDGLASGSALFITAGMVVLALVAGNHEIAVLGAAALGAIAGFLCFNRVPASIFLGDSGSLVLGSIITALSIRIIGELPAGWVACPIVLAHPFLEVSVSVARRAVRADHIFCPDRRHLHHRLLDRGLSHAEASTALVATSFLFACLGVLAGLGRPFAIMAATASGVLVIAFVCNLRYGEFIHLGRWLRKAPGQRAVIAANMHVQELSQSVSKARSMTELRILLSEGFTSMGFESARLNVRSYDFGSRIGPFSPGTLALTFPLYADGVRLGTLDLRWDVTDGNWPFDADFFASDFLPSLCTRLKSFGLIYRELAQSAGFTPIQPEILRGFVAEQASVTRLPLEN